MDILEMFLTKISPTLFLVKVERRSFLSLKIVQMELGMSLPTLEENLKV